MKLLTDFTIEKNTVYTYSNIMQGDCFWSSTTGLAMKLSENKAANLSEGTIHPMADVDIVKPIYAIVKHEPLKDL